MRILAIESSCDESAVAVLDRRAGLLAHEIFSQIDLHRVFGGVVPELASRDHVRRLLPLVRSALGEARYPAARSSTALPTPPVPASSARCSPAPPWRAASPMPGASPPSASITSKGICWRRSSSRSRRRSRTWRCWCRAGTRMLIEVQGIGRYALLGETRDDAAGEAFDKAAKLLGLPYPGGPELARLATAGRPGALRLPRPMLDRAGLEFSFSGLKTAVLHASREQHADRFAAKPTSPMPCRTPSSTRWSRRRCARSTTRVSMRWWFPAELARTAALRERMAAAAAKQGARVYFPRIEFCTDNAAMIAVAGLARLEAGEHDGLGIQARARWPLASLPAVPASRELRSSHEVRIMTHSDRIFLRGLRSRMHHRLHRVGAADQADRRHRHRAAGGLPPRRR